MAAKITMTDSNIMNCKTVISLPNDSSITIEMIRSNIIDSERAIEERDPIAIQIIDKLHNLGISKDTPNNKILALLNEIRSKRIKNVDDIVSCMTINNIVKYVSIAANIAEIAGYLSSIFG
ncbi:MAG: hypothetical protein P4M00_07010 [Azospirillaceae bacterium]|nr:hypothetical protein [Azospirillaceae bacterium]